MLALPAVVAAAAATTETVRATFENINVDRFAELAKDPKCVVLDVRTRKEYDAGHLRGATNIDVTQPDFQQKVAALDKKTPYLIHCASGVRSRRACQALERKGFAHLYNLEGGIKAWEESGKPVERDGSGSHDAGILKVGQPAPAMAFDSVNGKGRVSLDQYRGKFVLVDFFAGWCPGCIEALPELHKLQKQYADRLVILGVSLDTEKETLQQTIEAQKIDWPVFNDGKIWDNRFFESWVGGAEHAGLPHMTLVGPDGAVVRDGDAADLAKDLERAMSQPIGRKPAK